MSDEVPRKLSPDDGREMVDGCWFVRTNSLLASGFWLLGLRLPIRPPIRWRIFSTVISGLIPPLFYVFSAFIGPFLVADQSPRVDAPFAIAGENAVAP